jgi:hypothetical protein
METQASELFDPEHYLSANSDVMRLGFDPVLHYMHMGWEEGRSPNAWLDIEHLNDHAPVLLPEVRNSFVYQQKDRGAQDRLVLIGK